RGGTHGEHAFGGPAGRAALVPGDPPTGHRGRPGNPRRRASRGAAADAGRHPTSHPGKGPLESPPYHRRRGSGGAAPGWSLGARPQRKRDTRADEPRHSRASTHLRKPSAPASRAGSPRPARSQQTRGDDQRADPETDRRTHHRTTEDRGPGAPPPPGVWGPGPRGNATRQPASPATAGRAPAPESHPAQPALHPPEASRVETETNRPTRKPTVERANGPTETGAGGAAPGWGLGARPPERTRHASRRASRRRASSRPPRVELRGIEPLTYSMRTSRATNCATAPLSGVPDGNDLSRVSFAGCTPVSRLGRAVEIVEVGVLFVGLDERGPGGEGGRRGGAQAREGGLGFGLVLRLVAIAGASGLVVGVRLVVVVGAVLLVPVVLVVVVVTVVVVPVVVPVVVVLVAAVVGSVAVVAAGEFAAAAGPLVEFGVVGGGR